MTIYASTPAIENDGPFLDGHGRRFPKPFMSHHCPKCTTRYVPIARAHEANPILLAFRGRLRYQTMVNPVSTVRLAEIWASNLPYYAGPAALDRDAESHALKVLERIRRVFA